MTNDLQVPDLRGARVFVTGGTGFIGGRLIERLALHHGAKVRALVRNYHRAVRIGRFDVEIVRGKLTDDAAVRQAMRGCEIVLHCAFGGTGDAAEQRRATVQGTASVLAAAREAGVRRVVHVSTLSVYGALTAPSIDETAPRPRTGDVYADSKIEAEELALAAHREHGLAVSVIQPAVVYGPFGGWWTTGQLERLSRGRFALPEGGAGICNAVYVDDVARAIELAAVREEAIGQAFLIAGPRAATWREFFGAYERMLGRESVIDLKLEEIIARQARGRAPRTLLGWALGVLRDRPDVRERLAGSRVIGWPYRALRKLTPAGVKRRMLGEAPDTARSIGDGDTRPILVPDAVSLPQFTSRTVVSIDKARRVLGYEPMYDLDRGMALTHDWARWAGMV